MSIKGKIEKVGKKIKKAAKVLTGEEGLDKVFSSTRTFDHDALARGEYLNARERLFNVNGWTEHAQIANSSFQLYDKSGKEVDRTVEPGDFIKITIPGPFPENWVKVLNKKDGESFCEFTVRPSNNPIDPDAEKVEHFFKDDARSIFRVQRKANSLSAFEFGKDEAPNIEQPQAGDRALINLGINIGGWLGFQKIQWQKLTDYLVGLTD
ncbi:MAG: hypothetical protein ACK40G_05230 [Cytophagaceae bacterium]